MAKLIYPAVTSLDAYIADEPGTSIGRCQTSCYMPSSTISSTLSACILYGRKMYETMTGSETPDVSPDRTPAMLAFAQIWQAADKIVHSKSLETVATPKTRLEREFDPQTVRDLKARSPHDVAVAGPTLAAHAIRAGLVDEYHLLVVPIMLGDGKRILPSNVYVKLDLLDERRFANGTVYLRYRR